MDIKICSFNCCSLRKNVDIVRELTNERFDIIFLQETLVTDDKLGIVDYINENYECIGVGAVYSERSLASVAGRPQGGMACLWRVGSLFNLDKVIIDSNLCILCITVGDLKIVLVNVYLNSDVWEIETQAKYLENLMKLEDILSDYCFNSIYFIGDFNADPMHGRAWNALTEFMLRNNLTCFDVAMLDKNTITFTSYDNSHSKWLDHIIGRNCQLTIINNVKVHTDKLGSDHLPISATLKVLTDNQICSPKNEQMSVVSTYVDWVNLNTEDIELIDFISLQILDFIDLSAVKCNKIGCTDREHILEIETMCKKLASSVVTGSQSFAKEKKRKNKYKVIPGWNRRVKSFHKRAREYYVAWLEVGRNRNRPEFHMMEESRKEFKKALNECRTSESQEINQSIEEKYRSKKFPEFWKDVRNKKVKNKKSNIIDGISNAQDIVHIVSEALF